MVLLKSLVLSGLAAVVAAKSAVIDLMPSNFDKVVLDSGIPTLVEFYAPWCGHCKNLAPVYEELALSLEYAKSKVQVAKVDADAEKDLGRKYGVQGFPTLKFFDGKSKDPSDYSGGRDLESLQSFLGDKTGVKPKKKAEKPSLVKMLTDADFDKEIGGDKHVFVAFTAPWCGHCKKLAPTWEQLAIDFENEHDVLIAKVDADSEGSKATAKAHGVSSYPTIKFFPAGSKESEAYNGGRSEQDLVTFMNEKAGTHRAEGGGLDTTAGLVDALNVIVDKYTAGQTALADAAAEVGKEAAGLKEGVQAKYAEYYVKVFDKLSKNNDYASKELTRLDSILKKGGLAPTKLDEFTTKSNILRRFIEK
ncbi:thioredoxin-like protein, partial [Coniella lustricola]